MNLALRTVAPWGSERRPGMTKDAPLFRRRIVGAGRGSAPAGEPDALLPKNALARCHGCPHPNSRLRLSTSTKAAARSSIPAMATAPDRPRLPAILKASAWRRRRSPRSPRWSAPCRAPSRRSPRSRRRRGLESEDQDHFSAPAQGRIPPQAPRRPYPATGSDGAAPRAEAYVHGRNRRPAVPRGGPLPELRTPITLPALRQVMAAPRRATA